MELTTYKNIHVFLSTGNWSLDAQKSAVLINTLGLLEEYIKSHDSESTEQPAEVPTE